ncbi:MAG TPA: M28 family metallopeptidase [Longimicrobium sp.]|nr:M28 family metallopeptidase [Longimicrobium sp.]
MLARYLPLALLASSTILSAQQQPTPGFTEGQGADQRRMEAAVVRAASPARAKELSRALSDQTHVAGAPGQARTRDFVMEQMRRLGLETEVRAYSVYLPHATSVRAWRVSPEPMELPLAEGPIAQDPTSALPQYPTVNGYSAPGDVSGEVVYVNYGLIEDYAKLDSLGVSVRGKIAVARYGRSFRGIKAREAERNGAVGLILYSDPRDDGYMVGDVYPEGPMRPATAVQRGSVFNGSGDPSTPGYASTRGARRVPADSMGVPRIPVVPISYDNAAELLRGLRGTAIPAAWQGGLPFRYHVGPGPVVARVRVETDAATAPMKEIWNTLGTIRGSELPDEVVVIGAHRDAWGPGAVDNVSGTVSVLEAARVVMEQVRAGNRPRRTLVFATWDAEEWGLIGSTEFVEEDSARLFRGGVAYLNQDVSASGPTFGAGGSPSLRGLLRDVARGVPSPAGGGSVYEVWRRTANVADSVEPTMGDPGGGSDFAGFYNHLGIPHTDWGFGGPYGVYHSHYDSYDWMSRFGDPRFEYHAASASVGAVMMLRLANAEILPYDYVEFARTVRGYVPAVEDALRAKGWDPAAAGALRASIERMEATARDLARARDAALSRGAIQPRRRDAANRALLRVERALTRPEGLRTRPWYRALIYAADENNGYSTVLLPSITEAIRANDRALAASEIADLARRFDAATAALTEARTEIEAGGRR